MARSAEKRGPQGSPSFESSLAHQQLKTSEGII
jgi:hypothetical protein